MNAALLLRTDASTLKVHDANGDLPMHLALLEGSAAALQVLIDHGAHWFDSNKRGETCFDLYKTVLQSGDADQGKMIRLVEVILPPQIATCRRIYFAPPPSPYHAAFVTAVKVATPSLLATANALAKATVAGASGCSVRESLLNARVMRECGCFLAHAFTTCFRLS